MKRSRKPIPHFRTRPRLGLRPRNFLDPRSYVVEKIEAGEVVKKRVELRGQDMINFRLEVFHRARGWCEDRRAIDCQRRAPWDGPQRGELSHKKHGAFGPGDVLSNVMWSCRACHKLHHLGPQWEMKMEEMRGDGL